MQLGPRDHTEKAQPCGPGPEGALTLVLRICVDVLNSSGSFGRQQPRFGSDFVSAEDVDGAGRCPQGAHPDAKQNSKDKPKPT